MLDQRFSEDTILLHAKDISSSRLGHLSPIVIKLLKTQCKKNGCETIVELLNVHSMVRAFFQKGKDEALHEALSHPDLTKLLDAYFNDIKKKCKTATDNFFEHVTAVVEVFFNPIKNTEYWKVFWKKQAHIAKLENAHWHENKIAGAFLFAIILPWENFVVKVSGPDASREMSPLMHAVKLVLGNPSKESFNFALKKDLQNSIKSLVQMGIGSNTMHESIASIRETLCFQLCPDSEEILIKEMIQYIKPFQQIIRGSSLVELVEFKVPKKINKPPPLPLSAIALEKLRNSASPERPKSTNPIQQHENIHPMKVRRRASNPSQQHENTNPTHERKPTPRPGSSGRGRRTSPRGHSGLREIVDATKKEPIPPSTVSRTLSFFPVPDLPVPDLPDTTELDPPAPQ